MLRRAVPILAVFLFLLAAPSAFAVGSISGHVTGGGGDLSGICAQAYSASTQQPIGSPAVTDGAGLYSIANLTAGGYGIRFWAGCGNLGDWADEWFNNALRPTEASAVTVTDGGNAVADAVLDHGGWIQGKLTSATDGTTAVTGYCVTGYSSAPGNTGYPVMSTVTNGTGDYMLKGLAPGTDTWRIAFSPCGGSGYTSEFFHDAANLANATPITVTASQGTTVNESLAQAGVLSGTLHDSVTDGAIQSVCVNAWSSSAQGGAPIGNSSSDPSGHWQISLPAGSYKVQYIGCGSSETYVEKWADSASNWSAANAKTVTSGQTNDLGTATLVHGGIIGGITRLANNDPVGGICVGVFTPGNQLVTTQVSFPGPSFPGAPAVGAYKITVPAGEYRVGYSDCRQSPTLRSEYWDNKTDFAAADAVNVTVGGTTSLDPTLEQSAGVGGISGVVLSAEEGNPPVVGACVAAEGTAVSTTTAADGSYTLTGLAAGSYKVRFTDCRPSPSVPLATVWYKTSGVSATPEGGDSVPVNGSTVSAGPTIMPLPTTISGHVTDERGDPVENLCVAAQGSSGVGFVQFTQTDTDGAYTISKLAPGSFSIIFTSAAPCPTVDEFITEWYDNSLSFPGTPVSSASSPTNIDAVLDFKNPPPECEDFNANTDQDVATGVDLSGHCSDPNSDPLTYQKLSDPAHGSISDFNSGTGTLTYTPNAGYSGSDSFTYAANDGHLSSVTKTVTVQVAGAANTAPTCTNVGPLAVESTGSVPVNFNCSDADGDSLTYSVVSAPAHGGLTGSGASRTYTPSDSSYHGADLFTYRANDGTSNSNEATVQLNIGRIPACTNQFFRDLLPDQVQEVDLSSSCTDPDGDSLTYTISIPPAHGELTGSGAVRTYTPDPGYHGEDYFTYKANDGTGDSQIASVDFTMDHDPVCTDLGPLEVLPGESVTVTLSCTDADADALTYELEPATPTRGTGVVEQVGPDWKFTFTANANAAPGEELFFYLADDSFKSSAGNSITVHVTDVVDPDTTIVSGPAGTTSQTSALFKYSSNEGGDNFTCKLDSQPEAPCDGDGKEYLGLSPGSHTFTVAAIDDALNEDPTPATRTWTVDTASNVQSSSAGTAPAGGTVSTGATATSGDPVTTGVTTPTGGAVSIAEAGSATTASPSGYEVFGQQVEITAPDGSVANPLRITFNIDASLLTGIDPATIAIVRNGTAIPLSATCAGNTASPDPCYQSRTLDGNGDYHIVVLSVHASAWNFAKTKPTTTTDPPPDDTPPTTPTTPTTPTSPTTSTPPATTPPATPPPVAPAAAKCAVPKLKGLTLAKAKRALTKAHCRLGKVTKRKATSKKQKKGTVIAQKPAAGAKKPAGTKVALTIAK